MNKKFSQMMTALCFMYQGNSVYAREPYHATVKVGTESSTVAAPNLIDLNRDLRSTNITQLIPLYKPTSATSLEIDLRGIDTLASFAANSTTLNIGIPQAGFSTSFDGGTRDNSLTLFREFIRDAGHRHELLRVYAKYSPIDPIAGNPNSLLAQMAHADYQLGHLSPFAGCDCRWSSQPNVHQVQTGVDFLRGFSGGFDTTAVTLPTRYSYAPDLSWALILDAPITYNRNGGASSLLTSLGVGIRFPITYNWSLTPIVRFGGAGSLDLCTAGAFISTGVNSTYNYKYCNHVISLTNFAGYYTSTNLWLSGINYNYHIQNCTLKNGLTLTSCAGFVVCERPLNYSISFVDSYFATGRLYIRHYDEVGFSLITTSILPCFDEDCLSLGFAYQFGHKDYKGYRASLDYQF